MNKTILISIFVFASLFWGTTVFAQITPQVQTNSATNISTNQATLNGYLFATALNGSNYVYFQWGTSTDYSNQTTLQPLNYASSFTQNIGSLSANTTYHFRAVSQGSYGTTNGQDMTFYTGNSNNNYYGNGSLIITKKVINLSSGILTWQTSVNANPGDILAFAITMQSYGQDIHNVFVRDNLPANLIYRGNMTTNASLNYSGNPASGISIGTIPASGVQIISYQVQVAPSVNFTYGTTTLYNNATVTSNEAISQTASATVLVNNSYVAGATYVPTGATNNPVTDSFFLPVMLIILGSWFYFSGRIYLFSDWLKTKI
jgi:hypothetical protein